MRGDDRFDIPLHPLLVVFEVGHRQQELIVIVVGARFFGGDLLVEHAVASAVLFDYGFARLGSENGFIFKHSKLSVVP